MAFISSWTTVRHLWFPRMNWKGLPMLSALVLPYHPLCADLVPYLTMYKEVQEPRSPNKETSTVCGETDKKKERDEDREVLTSFTEVTGPKKGSSDLQKSSGNHPVLFGILQNGTHAQVLLILCFAKMRVITLICFPSWFSSVGKHSVLPGNVWTSSKNPLLPVSARRDVLLHCTPGQPPVMTTFNQQHNTSKCYSLLLFSLWFFSVVSLSHSDWSYCTSRRLSRCSGFITAWDVWQPSCSAH